MVSVKMHAISYFSRFIFIDRNFYYGSFNSPFLPRGLHSYQKSKIHVSKYMCAHTHIYTHSVENERG